MKPVDINLTFKTEGMTQGFMRVGYPILSAALDWIDEEPYPIKNLSDMIQAQIEEELPGCLKRSSSAM